MLEAFAAVPVADYAERCGVEEALIRGAARRIGVRAQRRRLRGPRHPAGAEQHPQLLPEQDALDADRQLRPSRAASTCTRGWRRCSAPGRVGKTPVTGAPVIGGLVPVQRDPRRDPHRPSGPLPGDAGRELEPGPLARRLAADARGARGARAAGRDRRRDDRDGAARRLRAAGLLASSRSRRRRSSTSSSRTTPSSSAHPLLEPLEGTLPEPEIYARLIRELDVVDDERARAAARGRARGPRRVRGGLRRRAVGSNPQLGGLAAWVLYETLGETLPDGLRGAAALWGLAQRCAMTYPDAVRRAGHADGDALFDAILASPSGLVFTADEYERRLRLHDRRPTAASRSRSRRCSRSSRALARQQPGLDRATQFPIVVSAGERRAYTANDIFRDAGLAQARQRRRPADQPRGRRRARARRRRPRPGHDRPRQRRGDRSR